MAVNEVGNVAFLSLSFTPYITPRNVYTETHNHDNKLTRLPSFSLSLSHYLHNVQKCIYRNTQQ